MRSHREVDELCSAGEFDFSKTTKLNSYEIPAVMRNIKTIGEYVFFLLLHISEPGKNLHIFLGYAVGPIGSSVAQQHSNRSIESVAQRLAVHLALARYRRNGLSPVDACCACGAPCR